MTNDEAEARPANRMTNGADGCARRGWERGVRAEAVSPLRSATAVQDALRCWMLCEVEHWRAYHVAADHRSALRSLRLRRALSLPLL